MTAAGWRRPHGDGGAAAVEFVLLFVFLFVPLCFGTISGGIVFSDKLALTQGVREAARYGATLPYDPAAPTTFLTTVRDAAGESDFGQLGSGDPSYCVAFRESGGTQWHMKTTDSAAQSGPCAGTAGPARTHVLVVATKNGSFDLIVTDFDVPISSTSIARYEEPAP